MTDCAARARHSAAPQLLAGERWDGLVLVAENFAARREQLAARRGVSDTWAYRWAHEPAGRVPRWAAGTTRPARAVTALYEAHAVGLIRLAVVMLGDRAATEDVVQEAFCGLYRRWGQLADPGKALSYARAATLNGCRSELRHRIRAQRRGGRRLGGTGRTPRRGAPAGPQRPAAAAGPAAGGISAPVLPRPDRAGTRIVTVTQRPPAARGQIAEFSARTGQAAASPGRGLAAIGLSSSDVLWTSSSGTAVIVEGAAANPARAVTAVVSGGRFTPLPGFPADIGNVAW